MIERRGEAARTAPASTRLVHRRHQPASYRLVSPARVCGGPIGLDSGFEGGFKDERLCSCASPASAFADGLYAAVHGGGPITVMACQRSRVRGQWFATHAGSA